jgi:signal transduction histidine kinase
MLRSQVPRHVLGFRALTSVFIVVMFAAFEQIADIHLARYGLSRSDILLDDIIGAVLLGIIFFLWLTVVDEHHRRVHAEQRRELTAEMNHHIRNALTVIKYSAHSENGSERVHMTDEAVERIESTLRELLPAMPEDNSSTEDEFNSRTRRAI